MANKPINRRNFLKGVGAAGIGSVMASNAGADPNAPAPQNKAEDTAQPKVPTRILGKTGVEVPVLSLGCMFDAVQKQIVLRKALQWGVTYWDTAHGYMNGNSELGVGRFLEKNPEARKQLFIVSKASGADKPEDIEARLQESLKRMNTDYVDLYYAPHGCNKPEQLNDELRDWAASAKQRGLIKFFGFSTHDNMADVMLAASKLDWIDAIMTSYNFRLMQDEKMQEAVAACTEANIGLVAMKVMGHGIESEGDKKLTDHFIAQGFTEGQAKLKAVLADDRFANACIGRENLAHLTLNVAATLDQAELSSVDMDFLKQYAAESCTGYCAGCTAICDKALGCESRVGEVLRYLMYYNSYDQTEAHARKLFAELPADVRTSLTNRDYSAAEAACPQNLPIAKLIEQAVEKLA